MNGERCGWRGLAMLMAGVFLLSACSSPGTGPKQGRLPGFAAQHLVKSDFNRFAEAHQQRIFVSLRRLAEKLYKRNPKEWRKSNAPSLEVAVSRIFNVQHRYRLA